jgi:prepilin-type N-terminal cleavage/methylation domain-containing protein/prepilin-type processing-associated H-X9-DG protein
MRRRSNGVSLVEVMVVVVIIGILLSLLLPAVQSARESSRKLVCQSNLRQMALAVQAFHDARKQFPSLYNGSFSHDGLSIEYPRRYWDELHFHSWQAVLLSHLEQSSLEAQIDFTKAASDPFNQKYVNTELAIYVCPSTGTDIRLPEIRQYSPNDVIGTGARTDYESIGGLHVSSESKEVNGLPMTIFTHLEPGVWGLPRQRKDYDGTRFDGITQDNASVSYVGVDETGFRDVSDGLSRTAMIGEVSGRPELFVRGDEGKTYGTIFRDVWAKSGSFHGILMSPRRGINEVNRSALYSFHPEGANVAFADGSVHLLSNSLDKEVLHGLATRAGGEAANLE